MIVQHGEKERLPGDPGLTVAGRAEASVTAAHVATVIRPMALWSSPLRRARETAEAVAAATGLDIVVDDRLRERMNWDGATPATVEAFLAEWRRASADRAYVPTTGDSSDAAGKRFVAALDLCATAPGGTAVVVAHGGVTVDALRTIAGDDEVVRLAPRVIDDGVPCCALTTLRRADGRWVLESVASTDHLDATTAHRPD